MTAVAPIIVQLVHIQGPRKGEIQELSDSDISIGRHPDCHVQFPKNIVTISRRHARIIREGNRFKLIDQSTNGTFVNGQRVAEVYLKDGDVLTFAEGGPKLSFLTQAGAQAAPRPAAGQPPEPQGPPSATPASVTVSPESPAQGMPAPSRPPAAPVSTPAPGPSSPLQSPLGLDIENIKVPFAIQYGPVLKSFQTLPIVLGRGIRCHFIIDHPALHDQQAQIYYCQDSYWIKDLTGTQAVTVDGMPCTPQAPLQAEAQVSLSPGGPKFRFLAGGRLIEIEDSQSLNPEPPPQPLQAKQDKPRSLGPADQKAGGLFKKFFS